MNSVLIVGCGDVGRRVAARFAPGETIGIVRSEASAARLRADGIAPITLDLDGPFGGADIPAAGRSMYYFAPPSPHGERDTRVAAVCAAMRRNNLPQRVVYISTTAVYGDCGGEWIDETARLKPGTARGQRRLDAERCWQAWSLETGVPVVILRVPGIYGPDKLPLERLRKQLPVLSEQDSPYTNRIHIDDLATVCVAAMQRGRGGEVYNVSDGNPTCMTDYFNRVADHAGLPRPPVVDRAGAERELSASMLSFLRESKRLRNDRMLTELGVTLRYPDLASGLAKGVTSIRPTSAQGTSGTRR